MNDPQTMPSLLPCPLCNRPARMVEYDGDPVNVKHRVVHDDASLLSCPMDTMWCDLGPEIVAKRWNTRHVASPTISEDAVERALVAFYGAEHWPSEYTDYEIGVYRMDMTKALVAALRPGGTDGWIPVGEGFPVPPMQSAVLVCCAGTDDHGGPFIASGFLDTSSGTWQSQDSFHLDKPIPWPVTHWRALPKGPTP